MFTYYLDETFRMWISFLVDSMDNLAEIPNELEIRRLQSMCLLVLELMLPIRKSYLHWLGPPQFLLVDSMSILKINNKTLFIFIFSKTKTTPNHNWIDKEQTILHWKVNIWHGKQNEMKFMALTTFTQRWNWYLDERKKDNTKHLRLYSAIKRRSDDPAIFQMVFWINFYIKCYWNVWISQ